MSDAKQFLAQDDQEESKHKEQGHSALKTTAFLFKFAKGYRLKILVSILMLITFTVFSMLSGHTLGVLVGEGLAKSNWELAKKWAIYVLALELGGVLIHYVGRRYLIVQTSYVILKIRDRLFQKLSHLPLKFFDSWPQGRIVTRMTHDVEGIEKFFTSSLGRLAISVLMIISSATAMLITDFKIGLMVISGMIPAVIFLIITRDKIGSLNRAISKYSSNINSKLSEYIDGIHVIRSFGVEDWSYDNFKSAVNEQQVVQLSANSYYALTMPMLSFLCGLPLLILVWFGGNAYLDGTLTLALFIALMRYCERFFWPVLSLFREMANIITAFTSVNRVANFIEVETEREVFDQYDNRHHKINGEIEFKNVIMGYNEISTALNDISFKIHKGEKIGIVGPTGSGKTTAVAVLSRLYDYQKGEVLIDGQNLKELDIDHYRDQIGIVSQDVIIFDGTLRENLSVNPDLTDKDILSICDKTGMSKVMSYSKLTLDSVLKDGGSNLSAGEKQVISLTRVCLQNPNILILDEATAHVDPYFEKILHDGIHNVMEGKTSFFIAHRLDTIKECDRILVFKDGRLAEFDTPDNLMLQKGIFYNLTQATNSNNGL
ncbi:ABC transporter ATP-binding protein [Halobacteriovorax sp. CON-3]|uniref:ABC transporter ATP-binding protein n=1 Tax=Halobacteriovorax sp. CON-3 TaxID=3157710 RepID=UPI00371B3BE1